MKYRYFWSGTASDKGDNKIANGQIVVDKIIDCFEDIREMANEIKCGIGFDNLIITNFQLLKRIKEK
jgi:hypothetical protein